MKMNKSTPQLKTDQENHAYYYLCSILIVEDHHQSPQMLSHMARCSRSRSDSSLQARKARRLTGRTGKKNSE